MTIQARRPPSYREHKPSGQAVVTLQGRDHYLGRFKSAESRRAYDRIVGEWLAAGRPAAPTPTPDLITVVEVLAAFKRYAKGHYVKDGSPTGAADNFAPTYRILQSLYGRQPAIEVGSLALKAITNRLIGEGRSRRFISDRIQQARRIYKWAASEELIPFEAYHKLTTVESPRRGSTKARECPPIPPVPDAIIDATLPHLPPTVAAMVAFQRCTGARPGEVCQLRPMDIDRSGAIWIYTPGRHKTQHHGKARTIPISPRGQTVLAPFLFRDPDAFCFDPRESEKARRADMREARVTPLSCGTGPGDNRKRKPKRTPGGRYTSCSYRKAIQRACEAAFAMPENLKRPVLKDIAAREVARIRAEAAKWREANVWAPNQIRHTFATEVRKQFGSEAAQILLGHSKLSTTEIYAERDLARASAIVAKMG